MQRIQFNKIGGGRGQDFKRKEFERWCSGLTPCSVVGLNPTFYEVWWSTEIFTGRMENTMVKDKNNLSVTWEGVKTYSDPQKTQGSTAWHLNFVQMTKMTTLRNTVLDHTELIYTRSLQTAFRNTTIFLHLIPYGIQRLASAFPYVGRRALSAGSSAGTRQPLRCSYQFKRPGWAGKAVIWGKEVMKVENSSVKMPTLSLQPCFIIACYTVPRAVLHPNWGDRAQGEAVGGKCQVRAIKEPPRGMTSKPLTQAQPQPTWFRT